MTINGTLVYIIKEKKFTFNANSLSSWYSCIIHKVLKIIIFSHVNRVLYIYKNDVKLKIALKKLKTVFRLTVTRLMF